MLEKEKSTKEMLQKRENALANSSYSIVRAVHAGKESKSALEKSRRDLTVKR